MRKLHISKLKEFLIIKGKQSKEALAVETGISFFKIEKMLLGKREASRPEMMALCSATGLSIDELFPLISETQTA